MDEVEKDEHMTIKNYGLMWERGAVAWTGVRGNAGHLRGKGPIGLPNKHQIEADFREQIGVYVLYDENRVVYVGQAGTGNYDLYSRLKNHLTDHLADRWNKFSWFGIRNVNKDGSLSKQQGELNRTLKADDILNLIEGLMINVLEPPLNKQGARWKEIDQYYQVKEGWAAWSDRDLLIGIAENLEIESA